MPRKSTLYQFKDLFLATRLYLFNHFINRIPIGWIRINLMRHYMHIGKNTNVMCGVIIYNKNGKKDQIQIGNNSVINRDCLLDGREGKLTIGNNVDIARGVWIFTLEHNPDADYHSSVAGDVFVEDYCWLASRVTILPNVTLAKGTVVAAGAVVTKSTRENMVVGGVPARELKERKSKLLYTLRHFPFFDY